MTPDDGQVVLAKDKTLGYLAQNSTVDTSHTIYEELLSVKADLLRLQVNLHRRILLQRDVRAQAVTYRLR